jgi:signal transduction histidine kinase
MNSVTPISSLTETMQMVLRKENKIKQASEINNETIEDLAFSLETIQKRSDSLLSFVESYRKLTKVPRPIPGPVNTKELLEGSIKLLEAEINKNKIAVSIECNDPPIEIYLDRSLVEQVLINLITNAVHALEGIENPKLILRSYANENRRVIQITDNGAGIEKKELDQIFIPFYSTKKTGSGIGLSLSKQVMSLHHGNIRVESLIGKGTTFFLEFRSNQKNDQ